MNIGFVGLGAMGAGIVPRLMAAGHAVTGWNRSEQKAEPLMAAGMRLAETPRAVAAACDAVFSIVTDAAGGRARRRRDHFRPEEGRHLRRHEHDRARRKPRDLRRI